MLLVEKILGLTVSKIIYLNKGTLLPSKQESIELFVGCAKTGGPVCLCLEEIKGFLKNKAWENRSTSLPSYQ